MTGINNFHQQDPRKRGSGDGSGSYKEVLQTFRTNVALALNVSTDAVALSTDEGKVLDNVLYLYDVKAGLIYVKPPSVGAGETLVSLANATLTTNVTTYPLTKYTPSADYTAESVTAMKAGAVEGRSPLDEADLLTHDLVVATRSYKGDTFLFTAEPTAIGAATYTITTLAKVRTLKGDAGWVPDGLGDHYMDLGDGTTYVAMLQNADGAIIEAEVYGAHPDNTPAENDVSIAAAIQRAKTRTSHVYATVVTLGRGKYQHSLPILLRPDAGTSQRQVGFRGMGAGKTELQKVGTTTTGITGHDVDANIVELPAEGEAYAFFANVGGFVLSGDVDGLGYGYYAHNGPVGQRDDIQILRRMFGYYQDDCWMSRLDRIWSLGSYDTGISILGGTSVTGSNIYSDGSKIRGFNLRGLQYSHLDCACDRTANTEVTAGIAYDFELTKGITGQFNVETTHGIEFRFVNADAVEIGGRSFNSWPVSLLTNKISVSSSTVKFIGYDWTDTIQNLTAPEKANYDLISKDTLSSVEFDACVFSPDLDERFPRQLDLKFAGNVASKPYSHDSGVTIHTLAINNASFKPLCYVGNVGRFKLEIAVCTNSSVDLMYLPIDDVGLYAPSLSTSAASPDDVMQWYQNGVMSVATLEGFVQDNWLYVRPSNAGNNRTYHFRVFAPPLF